MTPTATLAQKFATGRTGDVAFAAPRNKEHAQAGQSPAGTKRKDVGHV